ncbi:RNase P and RNase MRP subunit [Coemansia sp. RSA 552]|nr:RNase P and RNase MRP subunit [Coemansia sp. RSA 552]
MATTVRATSDRRRQVFKHALEKPYATNWPSASSNVQGEIVSVLCTALQPLGAYFAESRRISKYNRRSRRRDLQQRQRGVERPSVADRKPLTEAALSGADLRKYVVLGINSTTRALEKQARRSKAAPASNDDLVMVVVCRGDVEPQLVAHFPALAHAARTTSTPRLRLIGAGASGTEQQIARAVGQQRASVVGIRAGAAALDLAVQKAVTAVPAPSVPWIGSGSQAGVPVLYPMAVRELRTTAPIPAKRHGNMATSGSAASERSK